MAAITQKFIDGPITCDVVQAVVGGQLVETRTSSLHNAAQRPVGVAAAASVTVLGVALTDAQPDDTALTGVPVYPLPKATAVATEGVVPVTYAASATYGALLKAAASGQVTPWVSGTDDYSKVVGQCYEAAGVGSGLVGKMLIRLGN